MGGDKLLKAFPQVYCKVEGADTVEDEHWIDEILSLYLDC